MSTLTLTGTMLPFNLDLTLACGQAFRWEKNNQEWTGMIANRRVAISQEEDLLHFQGVPKDTLIRYLALDIDLTGILREISNSIHNFRGEEDPLFGSLMISGCGLRILRQDPWECLAGFICSTNSNIPTIKKRIRLLSERYGKPAGNGLYTFPGPEELALCTEESVRECKTGYRAGFLTGTACRIVHDPAMLDNIREMAYPEAKRALMTLPGIGPKVADCVLLFGYQQYEAFPVDVWMQKIMEKHYRELIGPSKITNERISDFSREYFGKYAGYAQEYLFSAREVIGRDSSEHTDNE